MLARARGAASWLVLATGLLAGVATARPDPAPAAASVGVVKGDYILTPDIVTDERGRTVAVERGLLFVPENRRQPASRLIAIHFVRFPSIRPVAAGRPPVFLLAGGPGWGFDLSDSLVFDEITRLRATREVVSVSQRGYSGAPGLVPDFRVTYDAGQPQVAETALQRAERDRKTLADALRRWQALGVDATGYDIVNITDDLHDLLRALRYEKMVLRGCSFGSQWSLAYLKRWPETVDRAMLSGVEPLDYGHDSPDWIRASLARVAAAAEADPDLAPQIPDGGLMRALETVIGRLETAPVTVTIRSPSDDADIAVPVGADDLRALVTSLSLNQRRPLQNLAHWPRFILEMHRGDYRFLAARVADGRTRERSESLILPLINHSVGLSAARAARLQAEPAARWLGDINLTERITRGAATTRQVDDGFRADGMIDVPTLLIAGDYDWSTPVENAEHLARFLRTGHLVRVKGGRHCTETNYGELPAQAADATDRLYSFVDADFAGTNAQAFFATLPRQLALAPIDFVPVAGPSLYDIWRAQREGAR